MAENKSCAFRTSIGGQALIEGIFMRGPEKQAVVVRDQEGNLVEKVEELRLIKDRYPILGLPLIRGTVNFLSSMVNGVKALMYSADFYPEEEAAKPSKLALWLEQHLNDKNLEKVIVALAVVLGVGRAIGEAMAVMMVSGNAPNMPGLFESVRFLTTAVASEMSYSSGLQRQALFSIALVLFLFIMLINAALNFFLKRGKER